MRSGAKFRRPPGGPGIVLSACFAYSVSMTSRLLICAAWIATALCVRAASMKLPFITIGSITYSNVTVLGFNASDLFFTSDHGIRNVKLRLLSPDLQQKFNYDPAEAEKAEEQQAEDEKRYHDNLAAQMASEYNAARDAREAQAQAIYAAAGLADPMGDNSPIGKPAPDLDFEKWMGTRPNLNGKFAIVSIWSPKSVSCRKWIPALNGLYKSFSDQVNFIGVARATEAEVTEADPKPDFPCALDSDGKFITAANVTTFPCVMLLDTNHVVRYEGHPAALSASVLQNLFGKAEEQAP